MNGARTEVMATIGSAFAAGLVYGGLGKYWPQTTLPVALTEAIGGSVGAMFTKGMASEVLEGVGAVGIGLVGASVPNWISPPEGGGRIGFIPAGKTVKLTGANPGNGRQRTELPAGSRPGNAVTSIVEI